MKRTLIITGGGTGGHFYPGVAVAQAAKDLDPQLEIVFIGAKRGIEANLLPKESYPYHLLSIGPINQVSVLRKILSLFQLVYSLIVSMYLLIRYRPIHVLGFGGYASGPVMLAAVILRKKASLWEGNAKPGLVTRKLAPYMKNNFLAFPSSDSCYSEKTKKVYGVPTRKIHNEREKNAFTGDRPLRIFVFGGSQGAKAINELILELLQSKHYQTYKARFQWIHQVGRASFSGMEEKVRNLENYQIHEFVYDMEKKYQWADLVICRSGASTLAEISQMALPSILIPLPTAADNHQKKNAEYFSENHAAILCEQAKIGPQDLLETLLNLSDNPKSLQEMSDKAGKLAHQEAASKIASTCLGAIE